MYNEGRGVEKDYAEAEMWYRKAADRRHTTAQVRLGLKYTTGDGVEKDEVEGARWFRKAAELGDAVAQYSLGVMYNEGRGVEKDNTEAYAWFNLAARFDTDAAGSRDDLEKMLSPQQVAEAQKRTKELRAQIEAKAGTK